MSNGSYLLVGYPQGGPTALVFRDDAGPLRQALEATFGHVTDEAATNKNENGNSSKSNNSNAKKDGSLPEGIRLLPMRSDIPRWLEGISNG